MFVGYVNKTILNYDQQNKIHPISIFLYSYTFKFLKCSKPFIVISSPVAV